MGGGRAEPICLTAAAGNVPFTNKIISFPDFMAQKSTLPFGQLPILTVEYASGKTKTFTQSNSILRYFGKRGGLYPTDDDMEAMEVDSVIDILDDMVDPLRTTVRGAVKSLIRDTEFTNEEKMDIRKRWIQKFPIFLNAIETKLKESESGWVAGGSNVTIADLSLYVTLIWIKTGILDGIPTNVIDEYPACLALMEKVTTVEGIKKWKEEYTIPYKSSFDFQPNVK